jgi:hypothetical protein
MSTNTESVQTFPARTWARLTDGEEVVGEVLLTFRVWHEDGFWQAKCAELEVPSFGDEPVEALSAVIDATIGYLNEIEGQEERERIFSEQGLTLQSGSVSPDEDKTTTVGRDQGELRLGLGLATASGQ